MASIKDRWTKEIMDDEQMQPFGADLPINPHPLISLPINNQNLIHPFPLFIIVISPLDFQTNAQGLDLKH